MPSRNGRPADFVVAPEDLRITCNPESLGFSCTHEIAPPVTFIGQERAVSALEFGLEIERPGYNIFVSGLPGTGKSTVVRSHIREAVRKRNDRNGRQNVFDWCYVYNFERPDSPAAVQLPRGRGSELVRDLDNLLETLRRDLTAAYKDDSYKGEVRRISDQAMASRREIMIRTESEAQKKGFGIQAGPAGIAVIPLADGKPMDQQAYIALSDEQRADLEEARRQTSRLVEAAVSQIQELEQQSAQSVADLDRKVAEHTIDRPFARLSEKYETAQSVLGFLEGLRKYTLESIRSLRGADDDGPPQSQPGQSSPPDPLLPFRVNLFVDNSRTEVTPIIVEDNPTYQRLFGQIERRSMMGTYVTDHTMLKAGALALANGGFLAMEAKEVLSHPMVWPALKRILRGGAVRPEDPADIVFPGIFPQSLRPEAIPIRVTVVMSGEPDLYYLLSALDPDFWEIFKVHADLDHRMLRQPENIRKYAEFICGVCNERGLKHFSGTGVAAVVEHGARLVSDQKRLSARFGVLVDLLVESSYWAERDNAPMVGREHVEKALEQKVYRSSRIADMIQTMMVEGSIMVDVEGSRIGQANGLAVYSTGELMFGKPTRITAITSLGREGFVNVEREAKLSGQTHDKGVMIIAGYLRGKFAQDAPLSVNISIAFEQNYGLVDGDSASSTELYTIISSLSGVPLRQNIAVTGSVNQHGQIQPIGGVNEKIEGFFDLCVSTGKLGEAGVLIPAQNVTNLMLRPDVVEACKKGQFRVFAIRTVDEGLTVLTGVPAGDRRADGTYPPRSVNGLAEKRLMEYAEAWRKANSPVPSQHPEQPPASHTSPGKTSRQRDSTMRSAARRSSGSGDVKVSGLPVTGWLNSNEEA